MKISVFWDVVACTLVDVYQCPRGTYCLELLGRRFTEVHVTLASLSFQSSVFELARLPDFADLAVIPEDAVRDRGASFAASQPDSVHVVVDRHLVTGQNEASTLTAVQNLVLLCNQRYEFIIPEGSSSYFLSFIGRLATSEFSHTHPTWDPFWPQANRFTATLNIVCWVLYLHSLLSLTT